MAGPGAGDAQAGGVGYGPGKQNKGAGEGDFGMQQGTIFDSNGNAVPGGSDFTTGGGFSFNGGAPGGLTIPAPQTPPPPPPVYTPPPPALTPPATQPQWAPSSGPILGGQGGNNPGSPGSGGTTPIPTPSGGGGNNPNGNNPVNIPIPNGPQATPSGQPPNMPPAPSIPPMPPGQPPVGGQPPGGPPPPPPPNPPIQPTPVNPIGGGSPFAPNQGPAGPFTGQQPAAPVPSPGGPGVPPPGAMPGKGMEQAGNWWTDFNTFQGAKQNPNFGIGQGPISPGVRADYQMPVNPMGPALGAAGPANRPAFRAPGIAGLLGR